MDTKNNIYYCYYDPYQRLRTILSSVNTHVSAALFWSDLGPKIGNTAYLRDHLFWELMSLVWGHKSGPSVFLLIH